MSDIHQEWRELRKKNGDFICHLDGEVAKIEKEKKLLDKQKEQIFYDPMTCTYFKAGLEEIQKKFESMRKDLTYKSECIDKMTADYSALIEENANLQKQLDAAQKEVDEFTVMYDKVHAEAHQAKVAKDRMGYSNRCMQSKIAKQANEIKRLTEENEKLRDHHAKMSNMIDKLNDDASDKEILYHDLWLEKNSLKKALDTAAKDAGANFDRGYRKGMDELWAVIRYLQNKSPSARADICGFRYMNDFVSNLSAQDFAKKVTEWEEKEAHDIKIGDEVISISPFGSDDSECFIVYSIEEKADGTIIYHSIGSGSSLSFSKKAIADGSVRKTGKHYDSVPFDYID